MPQPGELGIRERRSWRTWQLATACAVTLLVGMILGHTGAPTASSSNAVYTPPPPSGTSATSTGHPTSTSTSRTTPSTPSTPTTASPPTTAAPAVAVLLPQVTARGAAVTPSFRAGAAGWRIGWAYDCRAAPGRTGTFQVFAVPPGPSPSLTGSPAVDTSGATGQGVAQVGTTGTEILAIRTPAQCVWAVKVTGVPG